MPIDRGLLDLMVDEVSWQQLASKDLYRTRTYGAATTLQARVVYETREIRNDRGEIVLSTACVWIGGAPGIGVNDRLTLADGVERTILRVERYPDEVGPHHEKVYLG